MHAGRFLEFLDGCGYSHPFFYPPRLQARLVSLCFFIPEGEKEEQKGTQQASDPSSIPYGYGVELIIQDPS